MDIKGGALIITTVLFLLGWAWAGFVMFNSEFKKDYKEQKSLETVSIGDVYVIDWNAHTEDPFEKPELDTVEVKDIKSNHALLEYKYDNRKSNLSMSIKALNYIKIQKLEKR